MARIQKRKIIKIGSSFLVTLPPDWIRYHVEKHGVSDARELGLEIRETEEEYLLLKATINEVV